jgi:hypothetical protein
VGASTRAIYHRRILEYMEFVRTDGATSFAAVSVQRFIAKLHLEGRSHVSALKFHSKRHTIRNELESNLVKTVLKGFRNTPTAPTHQKGGCSIEQLARLLHLARVQYNDYEAALVSCMFSSAFLGFLRVSEYSTPANHALRSLGCRVQNGGLHLTIHSSKTNRDSVVVRLEAQPAHVSVCPLTCYRNYIRMRPTSVSAQLFIRSDRAPVAAAEVSGYLGRLAGLAGFVGLSSHSFRIGGATWAARSGWQDAAIRAHGRWQSSAFLQYVRPV